MARRQHETPSKPSKRRLHEEVEDDSPAVTDSEEDDPMVSDEEEDDDDAPPLMQAGGSDDDNDDDDDSDGDDADRRPPAHATTPLPTLRAQKQLRQQRPPIYDAEAMHDRLEDIAWVESEGVTWAETLALTPSTQPSCPPDLDVDDDLARELCFYNQALASAQQAAARFEAAGVAWHRPADYYAEMVKSDEHMAKVKDRLMYEQQTIEQAEERRKAREQKAFAKQTQAAKQRERAAEKKKAIEAVSALRKQRARTGFAGELDDEAAVHGRQQQREERQQGQQQRRQGPGGRQQALGFKPGERIRRDGPEKGKKRVARDAKYGFGGRKRLSKQNDARSAADMSDYKPGKFRDQFGGRGGGGVGKKRGFGGGGGGGGRPGKARRQQQRGGGGGGGRR
jgi:rRNA-processing protein EBP2